MREQQLLAYVRVKIQEMKHINDLHRLLYGTPEHKVNILRYVFGVRPSRSAKYRMASKVYEYARSHNLI